MSSFAVLIFIIWIPIVWQKIIWGIISKFHANSFRKIVISYVVSKKIDKELVRNSNMIPIVGVQNIEEKKFVSLLSQFYENFEQVILVF